MPDEVKNLLTHRCFDACFASFNDKNLNVTEKNCMKTCLEHYALIPKIYQETQQFQGFREKKVIDISMPNPKKPGSLI